MRFTPPSPLRLDAVRIPDCICITRPFFAETSVSRGKVYRPSHACSTIEERVTGAIGVVSAAEVCCAVFIGRVTTPKFRPEATVCSAIVPLNFGVMRRMTPTLRCGRSLIRTVPIGGKTAFTGHPLTA
jgi:hypothetical protein